MDENSWKTISADEYEVIFERFGGSFAVHPDVVAVVASLAKRSVRYVGLAREGRFIAAVPLWGEHIVATTLALKHYGELSLIDVGDSEVILPVADNQLIDMPFEAQMISNLHANNIANIELEIWDGGDPSGSMMIAKSIEEHSGETKRRRRRETRRFLEFGGRFHPISELTVDEIIEIFAMLCKKRRGDSVILNGFDHLSTVFRELKHMMRGDILLFDDRPVAMELLYGHETPRWLFVNGVQRVSDPEFWSHSVGSILTFRNLEQLENEARVRNKILRYCHGWNDAPYKAAWAFAQPSYRLRRSQYSSKGDQTRDNNIRAPLEEGRATELVHIQDADVSLGLATHELAEVSIKSSERTEYLREPVADICRKFDRAELNTQYLERRSVVERILFDRMGRPIEPLRRLLFHTSGEPRGIFRRLVLHKSGTPRGMFSHCNRGGRRDRRAPNS